MPWFNLLGSGCAAKNYGAPSARGQSSRSAKDTD